MSPVAASSLSPAVANERNNGFRVNGRGIFCRRARERGRSQAAPDRACVSKSREPTKKRDSPGSGPASLGSLTSLAHLRQRGNRRGSTASSSGNHTSASTGTYIKQSLLISKTKGGHKPAANDKLHCVSRVRTLGQQPNQNRKQAGISPNKEGH
jgi:hypothetical protein